MENILENPIILKKICSYFPLEDLVSLNSVCKKTRNIHYYATFTNFINKKKNPQKFFQYLIENHRKLSYLTMFNFGSRDPDFHYKYIPYISTIVSLFEIEGIQVYNLLSFLHYTKPDKFKCLISNNFSPLVQQSLIKYEKMESLVIHSYTNHNLSFVENFKKIQNLSINNIIPHAYFILPKFAKLKFLRNLSLTNFSVITNIDIYKIISGCNNLSLLNLTNSRLILISKIKKYPKNKLKKLILENPYVFDQVVRCFNNSIELSDLALNGSYVTISGITKLINNSFNLIYLDLSMTLINEKNLKSICNKLKLLKFLYINNCINISNFYCIKKLKYLEALYCRENFIENREIIDIIKTKNNLKLVDISSCNFLTNIFLKKLTNIYVKNPPEIISHPNGLYINTDFITNYHNYHFKV